MHKTRGNNSTYPTLDICAIQSYHVYYRKGGQTYDNCFKLTGEKRKELVNTVAEIMESLLNTVQADLCIQNR